MSTAEIARAMVEATSGRGPRLARATLIDGSGEMVRGTTCALLESGQRLGDEALGQVAGEALKEALAGGFRGTLDLEVGGQPVPVYIEVAEPEPELVVVGGGHIGRSLSYVGAHLGFRVTVIDDRPEYASPERFPEAERVICEDFETALGRLELTPASHVVIVTRGHKQDELALRHVANSPASYVGMIGSKRRVGAVFQHLADEGIARDALERVHSPIGIDIGAETPEEIAVSIIAEIIAERRKKTVRSLTAARRRLRS